MVPINLSPAALPEPSAARWDGANVHDFQGTYGDCILAKVAKVFPYLQRNIL